ncbi:bifunctional TVP38/TMEM64 family protein/FAD-dependent oxidoreductase [Synechococcus sp. FACHB-909]|uniref:FAD-dependent oxidoreductase n=1 Tax=Synechococcus sp. FACHB-909 TaxID=2692863 RepID=UPI0016844940|nr:bifunctional TVP38/TMEM64 family protein/FAD-dependent oxidoreductase [Synechococcus sp. FACHB-909]MBD2718118.1 FAD-dependent oxidoreductase [Synechococcus sp. FACHB-909]
MAPPLSPSRWRQLLLIAAIALVVVLFFALGLHRQLTLEALQAAHGALLEQRRQTPLPVAGAYLLLYVLVAALSLPGAAVLTLAGGALFGVGLGTLLVSFASSIGALLAFLVARTLLRDPVRRRFARQLAPIEAGVARDGVLYLLSLRLAPVFPFFLVNLLMALTPIRAASFYLTSQIGMLPGTFVYVNAGTQLAQLRGIGGILSPPLLGSLLLLALFPWLAKAALGRWQTWRLYRRWPRPRRFDRNLIVIGAGAAGLVTAYIAATVKARVTLVERGAMGGDCLNTGCVPSKALISSARLAARLRRADRYGLEPQEPRPNLRRVLERVAAKVAAVAPHDSVKRYEGLGVEVLRGQARLLDPWTVAIRTGAGTEQRLTARAIVLATGAEPVLPDWPGSEAVPLLTSETVWGWLAQCPLERPRLVVLGGGPIACELAQALAQLGLPITQIQRSDRLLRKEDADVAAEVRQALEEDGVTLHMDTEVLGFERDPAPGGAATVLVQQGERRERIACDAVLCALGRRARLQGYGLEELGIPTGATITTNAFLQTLYPNIYAAGDVAGPFQFTHTAAHQAWYAAVNALFGQVRSFQVDNRVIPRTTFTDPEVATVGLTEAEAAARGVAVEVTRFPLHELDRAIVESAERGFVKVLTPPGSDRILGATIVAEHAGELLAEFVLAMKWGLGLGRIFGTIHAYPTLAEASKYTAAAWKKQRVPQHLLPWLRRYHTWRRRG